MTFGFAVLLGVGCVMSAMLCCSRDEMSDGVAAGTMTAVCIAGALWIAEAFL